MGLESKFIWMNGKLVEFEKANIHFLTSALHYGAAVFEGIRCYETGQGPAVFRLKEHMERLVNSARILGFRQLPYTVAELCDAAKQTIAANGFTECYIRPLIYLGGVCGDLHVDTGSAEVGIAAWEWKHFMGEEALEKGIRVHVSSFTRHHPNVMMTKAKISGNYANSILAKTEAVRLGFNEALLLDPQGYVAECAGENLFMVRQGRLYTPPLASVLEGLTRDSLIAVARDAGYELIEQPISRDQLYIADEVFVSGTAAECVAISEIDFRVIGSGKTGPVTRALQKEYHDLVHGKHSRSKDWLDPVKVTASQPA